jgi:hypothetical protein
MTPVIVSKASQWDCQSSFVKVPVRLLLCDALTSNAKLLWMTLANQAGFRPISKSVLDCRLGIHRSTRSRLMEELRDLGFVSGTDRHLIVNDPIPILEKLEKEDDESRVLAKEQMLSEPDETANEKPKPKKKEEKHDYVMQATESWNKHRPTNYQKINRLSSQLLKAIDLHLTALGMKIGDYDQFFSVLKTGIERSKFWSNENSSKTLQSIVGIGSPTSKKFQNVFSLYNDGLEPEDNEDFKRRADNKPKRVIEASLRKLIDQYDEAQYYYVEAAAPSSAYKHQLDSRTLFLIQTEEAMRNAGLEPADFRMMNNYVEWPTDTPAPSKARERFWTYTDEV